MRRRPSQLQLTIGLGPRIEPGAMLDCGIVLFVSAPTRRCGTATVAAAPASNELDPVRTVRG